MAFRVIVSVSVLFIAFSMSGASYAESHKSNVIQGQVVGSDDAVLDDFSVELCEPGGAQRIINHTSVSADGQFFFDGVPPSEYFVRVTSPSGGVIGEQVVSTGESRVQVRLADKNSARRQESALISMAELSHKVSGKVLKEAGEADKDLKKGDFNKMIVHLQNVVAMDPEFIAARRNLSLAYLKTRQLEKAIASFQELAALDPRAPLPYAGLSATYYDMNRMADSEAAARRALQIDSSYELGHFLLGTTLAAQNREHQQALRHLAQAIRRFPSAYVTAAGILARQGRRDEAKMQLKAYFDSGDAASRSEAEILLQQLY